MFARIAARAARRQNGRMGIIVPGAYAVLIIAVTLTVLAVDLFADDPGFSGVWLILVTLPLSAAPLALVPGPSGAYSLFYHVLFYVVTAGAGLLQAWILHVLIRGRRVAPHGH
ncbi:SCO4225 family membrane protein [Actinomadura roseirufa]|uniref:SCO4225 family membrane protein n=1 Tax=Actinomadura roseirufa TaxID=2094049 RepID=UPI0010410DB5|nr:hypothetical protein [Actinomadura roseirufa]